MALGIADRLLRGLLVSMGATAVVCGVLLIATDGLGMPRSVLDDSPFESFVGPGLILAVVVGGSHLAAISSCWADHPSCRYRSLMAGCILLGWIAVESILIGNGRALQGLIASYAIVEIGLSLHPKHEDRAKNPARVPT